MNEISNSMTGSLGGIRLNPQDHFYLAVLHVTSSTVHTMHSIKFP